MKKATKPAPKSVKKVAAATQGTNDDRLSPEEILRAFQSGEAKPYRLLDTGDGRKLEDVGGYSFNRQCPVAFWRAKKSPAEWRRVHAEHKRTDTGGGYWEQSGKTPPYWFTQVGRLVFKTKMTAFGHLGFFAEQAEQWDWFHDSIAARVATNANDDARPRVLNLFGYTGGSSIACALGGAVVTHVDAAKGVVDWSRQNAALNGVPEGRMRYAVEDCLVFLEREAKRGNRYDGLIMDPPSYGRGPNKEVFKLEDDVLKLLDRAKAVLKPSPMLFHFSCHTPGFTPVVLKELVLDIFPAFRDTHAIETGEMLVRESADGRPVPSGFYCRSLKKA